jgi:hypothetical protein
MKTVGRLRASQHVHIARGYLAFYEVMLYPEDGSVRISYLVSDISFEIITAIARRGIKRKKSDAICVTGRGGL